MKKHLHGRGEDPVKQHQNEHEEETPPRTWRRLAEVIKTLERLRNTSTDVEKTAGRSCRYSFRQKHLHGRGEDRDHQ